MADEMLKNTSALTQKKNSAGVYLGGNFVRTKPNHIVIGNGLAHINLENGEVILAENVEHSEAALAFWEDVSEIYGVLMKKYHEQALIAKDEEIKRLKKEYSEFEMKVDDVYDNLGDLLGKDDDY